jgi:hypothetical protein
MRLGLTDHESSGMVRATGIFPNKVAAGTEPNKC